MLEKFVKGLVFFVVVSTIALAVCIMQQDGVLEMIKVKSFAIQRVESKKAVKPKEKVKASKKVVKSTKESKIKSKTVIPVKSLDSNHDNYIVAKEYNLDKENIQIFLDPEDPKSIDIFRKIFKGVMKDKETLMEKYPEKFLNMQKKTGINSIFAGTAMIIESGGGLNATRSLTEKNNFLSIKQQDSTTGYQTFKNVDECLEAFANLLNNKKSERYIVAGNNTVNKIGDHYCNEPVDEKGTSWKELVNFMMNEYQNTYILKQSQNAKANN